MRVHEVGGESIAYSYPISSARNRIVQSRKG